MLSSNHITLVSLVKEQNKYYLNVFAVKRVVLAAQSEVPAVIFKKTRMAAAWNLVML